MKLYRTALFFICILFTGILSAQLEPGIYTAEENTEGANRIHEIKISDHYFIYTLYESTPAKFIKTLGGPVTITGNTVESDLEFNSNYNSDGMGSWSSEFDASGGGVQFSAVGELLFKKNSPNDQALDGAWLFATRGPDEGQERRGEAQERKTLKFLMDGTFQWIAFHTGTMDFMGTGGGSYTAEDGVYTEKIAFFSRAPSRVGAELKFAYEVDDSDWHHKGNNSKGKPMYEIWSLRDKTH